MWVQTGMRHTKHRRHGGSGDCRGLAERVADPADQIIGPRGLQGREALRGGDLEGGMALIELRECLVLLGLRKFIGLVEQDAQW